MTPNCTFDNRALWLMTAVHEGATKGEMAVLLVLMAQDSYRLPSVSVLWTKWRSPKARLEYPRRAPDCGPLLPFTRQGALKAVKQLIARGWVEFEDRRWQTRDLPLRLLPLIVQSKVLGWLADLAKRTVQAESPTTSTGATPSFPHQATETPVAKSRHAVASSPRRPKPKETPVAVSSSGRDLFSERGCKDWQLFVEVKPQNKRGQKIYWIAKWKSAPKALALSQSNGSSPVQAVRALVFNQCLVTKQHDKHSNAAPEAAAFPFTDIKQLVFSMSGRGASHEWNKFPKTETWRVRARAESKRKARA